MSLTLKKSDDFTPMPAGTHSARCYQVIDIGTQRSEYQGDVKYLSKVILSFETPNERMEDGKPFIIHQEYTASMGEKANLRQHLETWRGQPFTAEELAGFDISKLLTQACVITVVHKTSGAGNTYAKITGIGKPMKDMVVPELENSALKWEMGDDLSKLPEWIQKKVASSMEQTEGNFQTNGTPQGSGQTQTLSKNPGGGLPKNPDFDDDIPF
jgi:hypothetical protein